MGKQTIVDIVIPTYNRPLLTLEAVHSCLEQTEVDYNIYIIDDNSTKENSLTLYNNLKELKCSYIHYTYLKQNLGVSYARNFGASLGKSPYISFLDSDDLWQPNKLKEQVQYLKDNFQFQYIHTNESWVRDQIIIKQQKTHLKQEGFFIERLLKRCLISPSAVMFKRKLWNSLDIKFKVSFRVAEDYELWLRLNFLHPIAYLEEALTIKRAGEWSQLSRTREIDRQRVLALYSFYKRYHTHDKFVSIYDLWFQEVHYKLNILIKGARKYHHDKKVQMYQSWKKVFDRLSTKSLYG